MVRVPSDCVADIKRIGPEPLVPLICAVGFGAIDRNCVGSDDLNKGGKKNSELGRLN
jgi:hypothetical protein